MALSYNIEPAALELFDKDFYISLYGSEIPDSHDPVEHFFEEGWRKGLNPNRHFDTIWYLLENPDVRTSNVCPLIHYALHGASEGRLPSPPPGDTSSIAGLLKAAFDADYYRDAYPDVAKANIAPLLHYVDAGWREYRNPSVHFDTRFYLDSNPDVAALSECPLFHYVLAGAQQGRPGRRLISPRRAAINSALDPREQARHWFRPAPRQLLSVGSIIDSLKLSSTDRSDGLIVSMSHDDYAEIFGGVQNCVGDEQRLFNRRNWSYLHLHPAQPLPMLADVQSYEDFIVKVRLNGILLGAASLAHLSNAIDLHKSDFQTLHVVIHHLLGFSPEAIMSLIRQCQPSSVAFWLHDYFTLCVNPPLLRNNVQFCGAPPIRSQACLVCSYGQERQAHMPRMQAFLDEVRPEILAPSETALAFWKRRIGLECDRTKVIPHGKARVKGPVPPRKEGPLRIAFVGAAVYHKGWFTFEELASRHVGDNRYRFFHFGSMRPQFMRNTEHIHAAVSTEHRDAMGIAIRDANIDAVVQWSLCYETFSFTSYEALAGGAYMIVRRDAGNVWPAVRGVADHQGVALTDENELFALFSGGKLSELVANRELFDFSHSGVTAEHLLSVHNV